MRNVVKNPKFVFVGGLIAELAVAPAQSARNTTYVSRAAWEHDMGRVQECVAHRPHHGNKCRVPGMGLAWCDIHPSWSKGFNPAAH